MFDLSRSPHFFIYSLFRCHFYRRLCFISFTSRLILFLYQPISGLILSSHHHYTYHITISSFCFICLLIDIIFTLGILRSMAHGIHYTCCISYMRVWVFYHWVFEPSFPLFLSPYHLGLHYVLCLKTTLRPWDQMSSSTASTWTGVWDLVDIWISSCFFFWESYLWCLDLIQLCLDYRDHALDDGWFDVTWFFWFITYSMSYWGIFRFRRGLQIFRELHAYPHLRDVRLDDWLVRYFMMIPQWSLCGAIQSGPHFSAFGCRHASYPRRHSLVVWTWFGSRRSHVRW